MSITMTHVLQCDHVVRAGELAGARCATRLAFTELNKNGARAQARSQGWQTSDRGDFCPPHAKGKPRAV